MTQEFAFSMGSMLDEGEIAINVEEDGSLFGFADSFDRLLESYGLESRRFCENPNGDAIWVYKDREGNSLTLEYCVAVRTMPFGQYDVSIEGIVVKPKAIQYIRSLDRVNRVDLRAYVKAYPKNVFLKVVEKMEEILVSSANENSKKMDSYIA